MKEFEKLLFEDFKRQECEKASLEVELGLFEQKEETTFDLSVYTQMSSKKYKRLYDYIREKIPGVAVSTDIIVGFPNETEEQFQHTIDVVDYCKYDSAFTFIFSPRENTPASRMKDEVSAETKLERFQRLLDRVATHANYRNQAYLNTKVKVLVEGVSKKNDEILSGYSESNKLVNFKGNKEHIGQIVEVYIDSVTSWTLQGYECE